MAVVLPVVATLAVGLIAAAITLYVQRLQRWNAAELQHSEVREKAYEKYLAACDRALHLRAKKCVDDYFHPEQSLPDEEVMEIAKEVDQQAISAIEDLQRHASNFEKAAPVLLRIYEAAFERNPPNVGSFELARVSLQEVQRQEAGLRKKLGIVKEASHFEEFKMRRQVRKTLRNVETIRAVSGPENDEVTIHQGDGEGIWYLVQQNLREWEELQECVTRQEQRSVRWKRMSLWPE